MLLCPATLAPPNHASHELLRTQVGPCSALAAEAVPLLFDAIHAAGAGPASTSRGSGALRSSYQAWCSRFGRVVGVASHRLERVVAGWSGRHGRAYQDDVPAWLFAVHTWLGVALRMPAVFALPAAARLLTDTRTPLADRVGAFESGEVFAAAGVANLHSGILGWYARDAVLSEIAPAWQEALHTAANGAAAAADSVPPDQVGPAWSGDDFRTVYEGLVPQDLRHALGEIYTPDAYVRRALDLLDWHVEESLLDPTCGMGAFLIEAVRRRLRSQGRPTMPGSAARLLNGLAGFDINPLAVLAARTALTLRLAPLFDEGAPATLPVYVADAILVAAPGSELPLDTGPEQEGLSSARRLSRVRCIAGNPPWVRWSQLPPEYASEIQPYCASLNVFSGDRYVGGIEPDMSAVLTHLSASRWLEPGGRLAFYLPAALFSTESGEGFRRMAGPDGAPIAGFEQVEDLRGLRPFEGVSAPPALALLRGGTATSYPVSWRVVGPGATTELQARPIPGTRHGPWLRGTPADHELWGSLFDAARQADYRARKGVTTDCNGVFFVRTLERKPGLVLIENDPCLGRKEGIEHTRAWVEERHVFPLLRGRGLSAFRAVVEPSRCILLPQRGMHGDPDLRVSAPLTWEFFQRFEELLRGRGSYRRYQRGKPFWSTWSTGTYTFSPWKVLWKEMSGTRFCAAAAGPIASDHLSPRAVVPDHKLYFVPVDDEKEAHYLGGILNAPTIARAVSAYAAQLSLGVSVMQSLRVPRYDPHDKDHAGLAELSRRMAADAGARASLVDRLDEVAVSIVRGAR